MKFLARVRLGSNREYEVQVFETDRLWVRLTRAPVRDSLGFWSSAGTSTDDWRALAASLDQRLENVSVSDRGAIANATILFAPGWDYWGPMVPGPIQSEVLSGEIEDAATTVAVSELPHK